MSNSISNKNTDKAVKLYEKAKDAFKRNNLDYAINLLFTVIELSPQFVQARHLMHLIQMKKLKKSKIIIITRIIGNILSIPDYICGFILYSQSKFDKAMLKLEKVLSRDPSNCIILKTIADCALKLDMNETAIDIFETIQSIDPRDFKNLETLGYLYIREINNLDKAKECFSTILQYDKTNSIARKGLSDVAALQTIKVGSYDDLSTSFLTKVKDPEYADITEKKLRAVKSDEDLQILIKETLDAHQKDQKNVKLIIELANYYLQGKDYNLAIRYYQKARNLTPEDYTLTKMIMEAETMKLDETILKLIKHKDIDPESEQLIGELQELRSQTVLKYLREMIAERPTDRELHYQLGRVYFETYQLDEALKEFQVAVNEPRLRLRSYNYLGLCFNEKKMFDIAEVQFNTALKELVRTGIMDQFTKEVMYNLATVYENMGQFGLAVEKFKEIYKVDIGFKDVAQKINKTYNR